MLSKKTLVIICLVSALVYHFIFFYGNYGSSLNDMILNLNSLMAFVSALVLLFLYIGTNWRSDFEDSFIQVIYDLFIIWILICYFRSVVNMEEGSDWKPFLLGDITGLSLFPPLFFIAGINLKYFSLINILLVVYCTLAWIFSLFFINYLELQVFLLMPIFYIIVTYPMQKSSNKILTLIMSISILIMSITNRAGTMRILISYLVVIGYYFSQKIKIGKKLISVIIFCTLISPIYILYLGIKGNDIFEVVLGSSEEGGLSQDNLRADTRTFLYYEVLQDLKINNAFIFGKGINGGYASDSFDTFDRPMVEVGFLQLLLKSGIVGFILYTTLIISAIFKALNKSENIFIKLLGLLLSGYFLMFFIENVLSYNLLNIITWCVVGMCHSKNLRSLNDQEIKDLFSNVQVLKTSE